MHSRTRLRRKNKQRSMAFKLQLTSLMDILIILVVFLLKSYALSDMSVVREDKIEVPVTSAKAVFGEGWHLIVSREKIIFDNEEVLTFIGDPEERKFELPEEVQNDPKRQEYGLRPLYDALYKAKEDWETLKLRAGDVAKEDEKKWKGELLVQADRDAPYDLLRKVMFTAGMAGYKKFRLVLEKRAENKVSAVFEE